MPPFKPCPFCGNRRPWPRLSDRGYRSWVECDLCKALGPDAEDDGEPRWDWEEAAIEKWNERCDSPPSSPSP